MVLSEAAVSPIRRLLARDLVCCCKHFSYSSWSVDQSVAGLEGKPEDRITMKQVLAALSDVLC